MGGSHAMQQDNLFLLKKGITRIDGSCCSLSFIAGQGEVCTLNSV